MRKQKLMSKRKKDESNSSPEEQREYQRIKSNAKSPTKNKESRQQKEFIDVTEEEEIEELMKKMLSELRKDVKEDMMELKNEINEDIREIKNSLKIMKVEIMENRRKIEQSETQ
ncbi:hypothetical protein Zmor_013792 [Zophobas morio]|uniref:Uncharacterized protein n=1 Tax=Zophobas morio TaxID=2755281 RepID=A0AA38IDM5_9CUCU|nr:hypothetical protein Zmor_013792 [Zophobas morio]